MIELTVKFLNKFFGILDDYATYNLKKGIRNRKNSFHYIVRHPFYYKNLRYVEIGDNFKSGPGFRLECWDAYLENNYSPEIKIGSGVVINYNVHIGAINKIVIGDNVLIGSNVLITDHMHGNISDNLISVPIKNKPLISRGPVFIEDNVWIGENVCILDNVRIGNRG